MPNSDSRLVWLPATAGGELSPMAQWLGAWPRGLMKIRFWQAIPLTLPSQSTATSIQTLEELSCRSAITESLRGQERPEEQEREGTCLSSHRYKQGARRAFQNPKLPAFFLYP